MKREQALLAVLCFVVSPAACLDNGLGRTPPMAWRSWNAYHTSMNQSLIMRVIDEIIKPREGGVSLKSLGYDLVGIDEGWEGCGLGVNGTQHYVNGTPAVDTKKFPDLKALVDYGHDRGVKMGFYLNGCACGEKKEHLINYEGDVKFTHDLGFDGVKIDSCGAQLNMTRYAELFNQTGRSILIENCHQGQNFTDGGDPDQMGVGWCPYNLFRTSGDIINVWDRVIENVMSTTQFLTAPSGPGASPIARPREPPIYFPPAPTPSAATSSSPRSRPGCFAYPDMLEVGQMEGSGQTSVQQSYDESESHFAAWAITSSPLVLGFDLTNESRIDAAWPIISNERAMAVSQVWEGQHRADPSGALLKSWQDATLPAVVVGCGPTCACVDNNPKCSKWAKEGQCTANPGYMRAVCPASCPSFANQTGWTLRADGTVVTPTGDCLDADGQLPAKDAGLNWLRTKKCDPASSSQKWTYTNNQLQSTSSSGLCLGAMSHWLWPQPMVSLLGCGNRGSTNLTLHSNGTLSTASDYGCFGVSSIQGPPSSLWRKPIAGGKTAVLAINSAALPHTITINVSEVMIPPSNKTLFPNWNAAAVMKANAVDVWSGKSLGKVRSITRVVRPHSNIFITLEPLSSS